MSRYATIVISLMMLSACGAAGVPRTLPASIDSTTLPEAARDALDAKWPKAWSIVTPPPQLTSCLSGRSLTSIVAADLDSDNAADLALAVTTPAGVRLVALMQRDDHYALFDVDALGDAASPAMVGVEKRGAPYTKAESLFHDFYVSDTLTTYTCSGATTSYPWGGLAFYKMPLAPSPK